MTDNNTPKNNASGDTSRFEAISALIDGESSSNSESLLDSAVCETECKDAWQRYHLVRDVLQRDYHPALSPDFASKVSQSLESDYESADSSESNVMSFADKTDRLKARRHTGKRPVWLPVAGLGIAASVAAAGFMAWQVSQSQSGFDGAPIEIAQNTSIEAGSGESSQPVLLADSTVQTVYNREPGTRWVVTTATQRNQQVEQRLNSLLINHLEDSTMGRVQGMMAHSRVVAYDSGPVNESF